MSYGAVLEAFEMCKNTKKVVKVGTCCTHAEDARIGDTVVMGAGANSRCLIDADEMIEDRSVERAVFEFPFLDQLLIMQTDEEWQGISRILRISPRFSLVSNRCCVNSRE